MSQPKPLGSLTSSLLARKGHAKPAMRPQGFGGFASLSPIDDLGWNDLGEEDAPAAKPPVLVVREALEDEIARQPQPQPEPSSEPTPEPVVAPEPVAEQPAPLTEQVQPVAAEPVAPVEHRPVTAARAERIGRELAAKGKAAFTLRLDPDRHLRLRLATAVRGRSAQLLVTEALDAFLAQLPEVEALASQLPAPAKHTGKNKGTVA